VEAATLCSNNTIEGTQWHALPNLGSAPLVADMSSDIASRPTDVGKFGLIFAGAQKNLGPSGVTIVIVRKDLAERADKNLPSLLQYRSEIKEKSLYHTPPTFAIYIVGLVLEWLESEGGVPAIEKRNEAKAKLLYDTIESSAGFYHCPVEKSDRSKMNVVFRVAGGDEAIEKQFGDQPLVKAQLLQTVASTLQEVGLLEGATNPQTQALSIRRKELGDDHPDTLQTMNNLGNLLEAQEKYAEAEPIYRETLEKRRRVLAFHAQARESGSQVFG
jgi:phosphoserine aminotransferase